MFLEDLLMNSVGMQQQLRLNAVDPRRTLQQFDDVLEQAQLDPGCGAGIGLR